MAFIVTVLSFSILMERFQSACPAALRIKVCVPSAIRRVAGLLPTNLSSRKISAPSGSDVISVIPKPVEICTLAPVFIIEAPEGNFVFADVAMLSFGLDPAG